MGGPDSWQYVLGLSTLAIFICYADRSNISVAILTMAQQFEWDDGYKGTVLSVFFLGYAGTQLLGGSLADRFGGKRVLAAGLLAWSACTFFTPAAAMMGAPALITTRIAMGLGEGVAFPAVHSLISVAVPAGFQSTAVAIVTAASYAGAALAAGVSPYIISVWSWPAVFYIFGAFAVVWLPLWLATSIPHDSPPPSAPAPPLELTATAGALEAGSGTEDTPLLDSSQVASADSTDIGMARAGDGGAAPASGAFGLDAGFWALTKRKEVWAICAAQYCQSWGMYALLNWLPTFFQQEVRSSVGSWASRLFRGE